jgi:O-succinylbenzoate synthase
MAESQAEKIRREQRERIARLNEQAKADTKSSFERDDEALARAAARVAREAAKAANKAEKLEPVAVDGEGAIVRLREKSRRAIKNED